MVNYPKVKIQKNQRVYVQFYINKKRYRLYNGSKFNIEISPNTHPINSRVEAGHILAEKIFKKIILGEVPEKKEKDTTTSELELLELALNQKLSEPHSFHHKKALTYSFKKLKNHCINGKISKQIVEDLLNSFSNNTSFNTLKRNLNVLFNKAVELGLKENYVKHIKSRRNRAKLHKAFNNIREVFNEIESFNHNLYLCCLLTYGCLLRPHREIRELKWKDFSENLAYIKLSGDRNKSGRNRVVPVPHYIRKILKKGNLNDNIFSNDEKPFNRDYFKTLWSRFKKVSDIIEGKHTLYSFRHSGAIEIFKRTGSLTKLQRAMGHSSLQVSLTYLRGLEVTELKEEDMPMF